MFIIHFNNSLHSYSYFYSCKVLLHSHLLFISNPSREEEKAFVFLLYSHSYHREFVHNVSQSDVMLWFKNKQKCWKYNGFWKTNFLKKSFNISLCTPLQETIYKICFQLKSFWSLFNFLKHHVSSTCGILGGVAFSAQWSIK